MRRIVWIGIVVVIWTAQTALGMRVTNSEFGFSLEVPEGFKDYVPARDSTGILHVFVKDGGTPSRMVVFVRSYGPCIRRGDRIDSDELKKLRPQAVASLGTWKEVQIDVVSDPLVTSDGERAFSILAFIPLSPEAIEISVTAPPSRQREAENAINSMLASLDGSTNWLTPRERSNLLFWGITRPAIFVAVIIAITGLILRRRIRKFRRCLAALELPANTKLRPHWTWYLVAVAVFTAGVLLLTWFSAFPGSGSLSFGPPLTREEVVPVLGGIAHYDRAKAIDGLLNTPILAWCVLLVAATASVIIFVLAFTGRVRAKKLLVAQAVAK